MQNRNFSAERSEFCQHRLGCFLNDSRFIDQHGGMGRPVELIPVIAEFILQGQHLPVDFRGDKQDVVFRQTEESDVIKRCIESPVRFRNFSQTVFQFLFLFDRIGTLVCRPEKP